MKVQLSIDDELLSKVDSYSDSLYLSRSAFVSLACSTYLSGMEFRSVLKDISVTLRRIADSSEIDDQSKRELAQFEALVSVISRQTH